MKLVFPPPPTSPPPNLENKEGEIESKNQVCSRGVVCQCGLIYEVNYTKTLMEQSSLIFGGTLLASSAQGLLLEVFRGLHGTGD